MNNFWSGIRVHVYACVCASVAHSFLHILYNTETCNECCLQISSTFYIQLPTSLSLAHTHTRTHKLVNKHRHRCSTLTKRNNMRIHLISHTINIAIHGRKTSLKCFALQFAIKATDLNVMRGIARMVVNIAIICLRLEMAPKNRPRKTSQNLAVELIVEFSQQTKDVL